MDGETITLQDATPPVWATFARALGAELRPHRAIRGATGLEHPMEAIAVDDKGKRIILISSEHNPRIAALIRQDVQASIPDAKVIVARTLLIDLAHIARRAVSIIGEPRIDMKLFSSNRAQRSKKRREERQRIERGLSEIAIPFGPLIDKLDLSALPQVLDFIQQAAKLDWKAIITAIGEHGDGFVPLDSLLSVDNLSIDREHGICPIPLYEFNESDLLEFESGKDLSFIAGKLRQLGIHQYFFPPPDQVALGLVDHGVAGDSAVVEAAEALPSLGHPLGRNEVVAAGSDDLAEIVAQLRELGLMVEGEFGLELTPEGRTVRQTVKFRPRESVFSRLLNRLSVNLNVTDLMR